MTQEARQRMVEWNELLCSCHFIKFRQCRCESFSHYRLFSQTRFFHITNIGLFSGTFEVSCYLDWVVYSRRMLPISLI